MNDTIWNDFVADESRVYTSDELLDKMTHYKCNHGFGKTIIVQHGIPVLAYCSVCKSPVEI